MLKRCLNLQNIILVILITLGIGLGWNNLTLAQDYSNSFITRENVIDIYCIGENCKNICSKKFVNLVVNKNFGCNNCCQKLRTLKTKKTCIKKYGVECSMLNKEIKDKIKKTMVEKYGCEHALQSSTIKEKFKNTCVEKFGVENPSSNQEVIPAFALPMKQHITTDSINTFDSFSISLKI